MSNKIKKILTKEIYVREIILLFIIVVSLLFVSVYTSLAIFEDTITKENIVTIIGGEIYLDVTGPDDDYDNESDQILIGSGETKYITLKVNNTTPANVKYKLYYEMIEPTVKPETLEIGITNTSINSDYEIIEKNSYKEVRIGLKNSGVTDNTIKIKIIGGYQNNELNIEETDTIKNFGSVEEV